MIFNVQELPSGRSTRELKLVEDDLELGSDVRFIEGILRIAFYKTNHFVEIKFDVDATVEMVCDRSLELFKSKLTGGYHLLYEPGIDEDSDSVKSGVRTLDIYRSVIDIGDEVRDTIMLEVPIRKVDPESEDKKLFTATDQYSIGSEGGNKEYTDPRWSVLSKLKQN